jgi:hypothetical protein
VSTDGVVLATEHTTILDTRQMPWRPHFGIDGAFSKILSSDRDGVPRVFLTFLPESFDGVRLPQRRRSISVASTTLVLDGELDVTEYGSAGPVLVRTKAGYWLDHPAGAAYGAPQLWNCPAGALLLTFRSGGSTLPDEKAFADQVRIEEIDDAVPVTAAAASPDGEVFSDVTSGARVLDSRTAPWTSHFGMHIGRVKVLSRDQAGSPLAYLTKTPGAAPDQVAPKGSAERHFHRDIVEQIFVTGGELTMREYPTLSDRVGEQVVLRPGYFLDRVPGSIHQVEARSPIGFASLEVRDRPGNYPFDDDFDAHNFIEKM